MEASLGQAITDYSQFLNMKALIASLFVLPLIVNAPVWSQANKPSSAADLAAYIGVGSRALAARWRQTRSQSRLVYDSSR